MSRVVRLGATLSLALGCFVPCSVNAQRGAASPVRPGWLRTERFFGLTAAQRTEPTARLEAIQRILDQVPVPIIFITGQGNIPKSVEAMKKGAVNFLQKPIDEKKLLSAIDEAFERSTALIVKHNEIEKFKSLVNSLTAREYEIFRYVITGTLNKQIASELGIAEHTVKNHRLNITEKLGVKSVAELINIADKLNIKGAIVNHFS